MSIYYDYLTIEIKEGNFNSNRNLNNKEYYFELLDSIVSENNKQVLKYQIYTRTNSDIKKYIINNNEFKANYFLLSSDGYFKKYMDIGTEIVPTGTLSSWCFDYLCNRNLILINDEGEYYGTISQEIDECDYETTDDYIFALEERLVKTNDSYEKEIKKFISNDDVYKII